MPLRAQITLFDATLTASRETPPLRRYGAPSAVVSAVTDPVDALLG